MPTIDSRKGYDVQSRRTSRARLSALTMRSRLEQLSIDGFEIERGTPADRIMTRLVRDGVAEQLPRAPK